MQQVFFYIFSCLAVFSSIMVICLRTTVKSVLFLILTFISTACLWLLLEAEFLAVSLILVYVGAVIVLFLFVIMMIDHEGEIKKIGISKYSFFIVFTSLTILAFLMYIIVPYIGPYEFGEDIVMPEIKGSGNNVTVLGTLLYNDYLFVFEIAGILFLVGMVAAIAISFRGKQDRLSQDISEQVGVKKESRLKLVKIDKSNFNN